MDEPDHDLVGETKRTLTSEEPSATLKCSEAPGKHSQSYIISNHWSISNFEWSPNVLQASKTASLVPSENPSTQMIAQPKRCIIPSCPNALETKYYKKYRICEEHAKSPAVTVGGLAVRYAGTWTP
jgi:hypothetical protein